VTFAVDDADTAAATATQLGGTVLVAPFDARWVRMAILVDPQGATFTASRFTPENKNLGGETDGASDQRPREHRPRESVRRWALSLAGMLEETGILGGVARRQPDVLTGEQGRPNPRRRQEPHPRS
jgi:hypothetical protein